MNDHPHMLRRLLRSLMLEPPNAESVECINEFEIPENAPVLARLFKFAPTYAYVNQVKEMRGRTKLLRRIDGHPDLHDYLWRRAGAELLPEARYVIRGQAAFAHPETKIIFALATGTHSVQVRVPFSALVDFPELERADRSTAGYVWVDSRLRQDEDRLLLETGFDAAASRPQTTSGSSSSGDDRK